MVAAPSADDVTAVSGLHSAGGAVTPRAER